MLRIQAALFASTGSLEMLVFHTLSAGNIGQLGAPGTVVPVTVPAAGEDADDGDVAGCTECSAEMAALAAPCPRSPSAAIPARLEQPVPAARTAISAAAAPTRPARTVRRDVSGITVASWHGPSRGIGHVVKEAIAR